MCRCQSFFFSSPCVPPVHSLCHKCLFERVCEPIHTARMCLMHPRFPPMFNLAERRAEQTAVRVLAARGDGTHSGNACYEIHCVAYTHTCSAPFDPCRNTDAHACVCRFVTYMRQSFILPDQMMRVPHINTGASFVLCDQMMRVAVQLVTSIRRCPILFQSHPSHVTVLLMLCKHISCDCTSVTRRCSPVKYGCRDSLYVWRSSLTMKY